MDEMSGPSPLLAGEIVFDEGPPTFAKAAVHIFLEDTTLADASAKVVVHQVMENVSAATIRNATLPFTLDGTLPNTRSRYTVRVLVDVDEDGKISQGDFISTASYPVLTRGYPDRVAMHVKRVR